MWLLLALLVSEPSAAPASEPTSAETWIDDSDAFAPLEEERFGLADVFGIFEEQNKVTANNARASTVRESSSAVWVIDKTTLDNVAALSINDYLRTIPGTLTREEGAGQIETNLRYRGSFPEKQLLIVVDGRATQPDGLGFWDLNLMSTRDVERIELVSGPASTRYGAGAFSGVLSITTKKGEAKARKLSFAVDGGVAFASTGREGDAYQAGAVGRAYAALDQPWQNGMLRLSLSGTYWTSANFQVQGGTTLAPNALRQGSAMLNVTQQAGAWTLHSQLFGAIKASPYSLIESDDAKHYDAALSFNATKANAFFQRDSLELSVWARYFRGDFVAAAPTIGREEGGLASWMTEFRAAYSAPVVARNQLSGGVQLRLAVNESSFIGPIGRTQALIGLFVEDSFRPIDQLIITVGLRADVRLMSNSPVPPSFPFSPRASVVWLINDAHSLRLDYGAAFRAPVAIERAFNVVLDGTPYVLGTPTLKDEETHAITLGYLGRIAWFSARIEAYIARTSNIITYSLVPYDSPDTEFRGQPVTTYPPEVSVFKLPYYFYNMDPLWIPGAAVKLAIDPLPGLRAYALYSFIPTRVWHTVGAGSDIVWNRLTVSAQFYWMDQWDRSANAVFDVASRIILNARAMLKLDSLGRFQLGLSGQNLVDVRFFRFRRPEATPLYRDATSGERLGPRVWLTFETTL
jgi:outer membrane receptor protein involved in Fe transport